MNSPLPLAFGVSKYTVKPAEPCELKAKTFRGALQTCIELSKYKHNHAMLAADLEMCASQLSKCLNGSFHFPGDKIPVLEKLCGNTSVTQWFAMKHNASLVIETVEQRLARENAELRAQLAKVAA